MTAVYEDKFIFPPDWRDACWEICKKFCDDPPTAALELIHGIERAGVLFSFMASVDMSLSSTLNVAVFFSRQKPCPGTDLVAKRRVSYIVLCDRSQGEGQAAYFVVTWASIQHVKNNPDQLCPVFLEMDGPDTSQVIHPCCEKWVGFVSTKPVMISDLEKRLRDELRKKQNSEKPTQLVRASTSESPNDIKFITEEEHHFRQEFTRLSKKIETIEKTKEAFVEKRDRKKRNIERQIDEFVKSAKAQILQLEKEKEHFISEQGVFIKRNEELMKNLEARLTINSELVGYLKELDQTQRKAARLDHQVSVFKRIREEEAVESDSEKHKKAKVDED